jgi:hypothetical protein
MRPDRNGAPDVRKLLGGYATGTLTDEERRALFEAALHDQGLFDELMREDALREALAEPGAKAQLLAALQPRGKPVWDWRRWLLGPTGLGFAGAVAATAVLGVVLVRNSQRPAATSREMAINVQIPPIQDQASVPTPTPTVTPAAPKPAVATTPPPAGRKAIARREEKDSAPPPEAKKAEPVTAAKDVATSPAPQQQVAIASQAVQVPPAPMIQQAQQSKQALTPPGEQLQARTGAAAAPLPAPRPAINFALWRRGADQAFAPVDASTPLEPGDQVRLELSATQPGFLHVLVRAGKGGFVSPGVRTLFAVEPGRTYTYPSSGAIPIDQSAEAPGYRIVFTKTDEMLPEEMASLGKYGPGVGGFRAMEARGKVATEPSTFYRQSALPAEPVVLDIDLRKR